MTRKWKMPKKLSLVRFDFSDFAKDSIAMAGYKKVFKEDVYVFVGEIPNMRGHCVVISYKTGKAISGYHTGNFIELTENET